MAPPPYTNTTHVRAMTGIQVVDKQDREIAMAIEWAWRELRRKTGETFDGVVDKEMLGVSDGKKYKYFTRFYPIFDRVEEAEGTTTNDPTDVVIFTVDKATPETYTEVSTDDYLIHGENGMIIFKSTGIIDAGLEIYISYKHDPHIIRHCETLLAAYYVLDSMPNSREKAMQYMARFEQDFQMHLMTVLDDRV